MAEAIQQRVLAEPGLVRLLSDHALHELLLSSLLECEVWVPRCLAETIHRMWLFRGANGEGFDYADQFYDAWRRCGMSEQLASALQRWCAQQLTGRSFLQPGLSGEGDRLCQTWEQLTKLLQHWEVADGMVVFARESADEEIRPAVALPLMFDTNIGSGGTHGACGELCGLDLKDALERASGIASSKKWIRQEWCPTVRFPSLDGSIGSSPLKGMSASLPFLAALRAKSKGRRFPALRYGFSGVLDQEGRLQAIESEPPWNAKRSLLEQIGCCPILPRDWPVNEPVQGALNELMNEVWDDCPQAEHIPAPERAKVTKIVFDPYLSSKQKGFVGREALIENLKNGASRHILMIAPQGTGKTSLMAALVKEKMHRRIIAHHFCQHGERATAEAHGFVRSLAAMLAERLPEYDDLLADEGVIKALSGSDAASALSQGIIGPLCKIEEPRDGVPRYIIVDALDEAFGDEENAIAGLLAGYCDQLPRWLKILATTRDDHRVVQKLETWERLPLDDHDHRSDIRQYVCQRLGEPPMEQKMRSSGVVAEHFTQELLVKSEGSFLYATLVLDGLEKELHPFDWVSRLPPGLPALYKASLDRLFPARQLDNPTREVFEVMLAAREALTFAQMSEITKLELRDVLERVQQLLSAELHVPDSRISFFHPSFSRWIDGDVGTKNTMRNDLAPKDYHCSSAGGHKKLAQWSGKEDHDFENLPDYSRRHGTHHFINAGDWTSVRGRLTELRYIECRAKAGELSELLQEYDEALPSIPQKHESDKQVVHDFRSFISSNLAALSYSYFHKAPGFLLQSALNHLPQGPVFASADERLRELKQPVLKRRWTESDQLFVEADDSLSIPAGGDVIDCVVDPDWNHIATLHKDQEKQVVRVWNPENGAHVGEWHPGHLSKAIHLLKGGRLLSISAEGHVIDYDLTSKVETRHDCPSPRNFDAHAVTPDGRRIVFSLFGKRVWVKSGETQNEETPAFGSLEAIGEEGCFEYMNEVWWWDLPPVNTVSEIVPLHLDERLSQPGQVQISPDGLSAHLDGFVLNLHKKTWSYTKDDPTSHSLLSDDGSKVIEAGSSNPKTHCLQPESQGSQPPDIDYCGSDIWGLLAYSPSQKVMFLCGELWSLKTGKRLLYPPEDATKVFIHPQKLRILIWNRGMETVKVKMWPDEVENSLALNSGDSDVFGIYPRATSGISLDGRRAFSSHGVWCGHDVWISDWDVEHAACKSERISEDQGCVYGACMTPDGKWHCFLVRVEKDDLNAPGHFLIRYSAAGEKYALPGLPVDLDALRPLPDPGRVRKTDMVEHDFDMQHGSWVLKFPDETDGKVSGERWTVAWGKEQIPFWGGAGFRRLLNQTERKEPPNELVSPDGRWLLSWERGRLTMQGLQDDGTITSGGPVAVLSSDFAIARVSADAAMKVIAVEAPAGTLTFFDVLHFGAQEPLIATACRFEANDSAPKALRVFPPCCAVAYDLPQKMAEHIEALSREQKPERWNDERLLARCPHCKTQLKFNPFYIDVHKLDIWDEEPPPSRSNEEPPPSRSIEVHPGRNRNRRLFRDYKTRPRKQP